MSIRTALFAALVAAAATPLVAQDTSRVYVTRPRSGDRVYTYNTVPDNVVESRRGVMGVGVDFRPSANDSTGATVTNVTPGSAADRAGIVAGDIIVKFDGKALVDRSRRDVAMSDDDGPQSLPGLRLVELASHKAPGDTVAVEWKHERQRKTAQLVLQPAATMVFSYNTDAPDVRFFPQDGPGRMKLSFSPDGPGTVELQQRLDALRRPLELAMPSMDGAMWMRMGGPLGGIQFAPLNADLGKYFGTTEGILVLDSPDTDAHVDLKGGDVILAIGDRKPANVEHLFRILGSYQDSETVNFDVMRDHRRITVTAKAEDLQGSGRRWKVMQRDMEMAPTMDGPREDRLPAPARAPGRPAPARRPGV